MNQNPPLLPGVSLAPGKFGIGGVGDSVALPRVDLGPELVVNGDFAGGTLAPWTAKGAGVPSVVNNRGQVTNGGNFTDGVQQLINGLMVGSRYRVQALLWTGGKVARIQIFEGATPFGAIAGGGGNGDALPVTFDFTATQTSIRMAFVPYAGDAAQILQFDNASLRKVN